MQALESATGYVRRLLTSRLRLRVSPEIVFVFDPSVEYAIRLEGLIEETKRRTPVDDEDRSADEPPVDA
jgi:ribosome-binding factor A